MVLVGVSGRALLYNSIQPILYLPLFYLHYLVSVGDRSGYIHADGSLFVTVLFAYLSV